MLNNLIYLTYTYCAKVLTCLNCLNLFHNSYLFKCYYFVLMVQRYDEKIIRARRHFLVP